jgi:uncharacterized protein YdeI (YjbR/CyaY-like superfamily)
LIPIKRREGDKQVSDDPETGAKRLRGGEERRRWLHENHAVEDEAWVVIQKARSPNEGLRYEEAVDVATCFSWIDGKMRRLRGALGRPSTPLGGSHRGSMPLY